MLPSVHSFGCYFQYFTKVDSVLSCFSSYFAIIYVHLLAQECNIEEIPEEEEPPAKSSKDKKANGPDSGKAPSLVFKITSKIPYKTVLKGILYV